MIRFSSTSDDRQRMYKRVISALCLFVLACIWTAGLWPFHVPDNSVSWLKSEDGVRFGAHAITVSANAFGHDVADQNGVSLEMWLEPAKTRGAILAFDSSPDPRAPFLLRQNGEELTLQRYVIDDQGRVIQPWFKVEDVFEPGKRVFISITSDKNVVRCYVNGVIAKASSDRGITRRELSGPLVVGNSTWDDRWMGDIRGLAIYGRQLADSDVRRHYEMWTRGESASLASDQSLMALYTFSEREGRSIRNLVDPATPLIISTKYSVLHRTFLRSTWSEYKNLRYTWTRWSIWWALAVNIFGFVPVGFVFFAYFTTVKRIGYPAVTVILLGFLLSFSIEALQWFLPNRDSGMTDLFTNAGGTALGVLLYQWPIARSLWTKVLNFVIPFAGSEGSFQTAATNSVPPIEEELPLTG